MQASPDPTTTSPRGTDGKLVALVAVFSSTCVAAAYMLTLIPNVEFFTMLVFLGGLLFGRVIGAVNGFLAAMLYFVFNIYGASPLPLLAIQVGSYGVLGLLGGVLRAHPLLASLSWRGQAMLGAIGATFVLSYTLLADLVFSIVMGLNYVAWVLQGLPFTVVLVTSNLVTFSLLLPLVLVPVRKQVRQLFPVLDRQR